MTPKEAQEQELIKHFNNICVAVDKFVGTKQDHVYLEESLKAIKDKLFKPVTTDKQVDDTP